MRELFMNLDKLESVKLGLWWFHLRFEPIFAAASLTSAWGAGAYFGMTQWIRYGPISPEVRT
jgi:hypothetical protein